MGGNLEQIGAAIFVILIFTAIWLALRDRGARATVSAMLFVASLVTLQLAVKKLESPPYNFNFPGLVTCVHFAVTSITCFAHFAWIGAIEKCSPFCIPYARYLRTVVPVAISLPVSVVFNNEALEFAGAGVCAIIGTLAPVITAVISSLAGRNLSTTSWCGVLMAFGGGLVIAKGEIAAVRGGGDVALGIFYAFVALLGRCSKAVIMDYMIAPKAYADKQGAMEEPLSVMQTIALTISASTLVAFLYSIATESISAFLRQLNFEIAFWVLSSALSALAFNFLAAFVLKDLGAAAQQIVGMLNTICIAAISVAFMGEHLPHVVVIGAVLILCGVGVFNKGQHPKVERKPATEASKEEKDGLLSARCEHESESGAEDAPAE